MKPLIQPLGDAAATVTWSGISDSEATSRVQLLAESLRIHWQNGFQDVVPAYTSLTLYYSPLMMSWDDVQRQIELTLADVSLNAQPVRRSVEIPVCYDTEFAMDLAELAAIHDMPVEEVIQMHCSVEYEVQMIGFSPGFPYLTGLPEVLATPRRRTPRLRVPVGSVAIGGRQTGIYSLETPGGWNIIGRTPLAMFRPDQHPPCFLCAGDHVRFVRMTMPQFHEWQAQP